MYSLEFEFPIFVTKERYSIRHHPDIASTTIEVRFTPVSMVVGTRDSRLVLKWAL